MTKSLFLRLLRRVGREQDGNVATIFALAIIPILGMVGAAVDFSRASSVESALQNALDSTALMLSNSASSLSQTDLNDKASSYFKAMFNCQNCTNIKVTASYSTSDGSAVQVTGSADVPTTFMQMLGYNNIAVGSSATAKWGTKLRVALVLDNTGSMNSSGKLAALKTASHNLLTTLQNAAHNDGDVEVAIVPFANGVNVDPSNVDESWLDWSYYSNSGGAGWSGSGGGYSHSGGNSYDSHHGDYGSDWHDGHYDGSASWSSSHGTWHSSNTNASNWSSSGGSSSCRWSTCWASSGGWSAGDSNSSKSHWQGCVTDRDQDYDVLNTNPTASIPSTLFPAIFAASCPQPVMGLSSDWTTLNAVIDKMVATGTTNQTIGLDWGWLALTSGEPFDNPTTPADAQRVIILLTDGLNTENRWTTDQSTIDARTTKVCDNIKADGITLYTIQVNTDGDPTSTLLQNCASDSGKFFLLTSSGEIVTTFDQIGSDLSKLRIAE